MGGHNFSRRPACLAVTVTVTLRTSRSQQYMHLTSATLEATIGLAMVPGALGFGEPGSEIQVLLALVVVCGSVSSTALNLFVVPAIYRAITRRAII